MKPSMNSVVTACLVRPLLNKAAGALVGLVQTLREKHARSRIENVKQWMSREIAFHDDHLLVLDAELTMRVNELHELRMRHRKQNVVRQARGAAA